MRQIYVDDSVSQLGPISAQMHLVPKSWGLCAGCHQPLGTERDLRMDATVARSETKSWGAFVMTRHYSCPKPKVTPSSMMVSSRMVMLALPQTAGSMIPIAVVNPSGDHVALVGGRDAEPQWPDSLDIEWENLGMTPINAERNFVTGMTIRTSETNVTLTMGSLMLKAPLPQLIGSIIERLDGSTVALTYGHDVETLVEHGIGALRPILADPATMQGWANRHGGQAHSLI